MNRATLRSLSVVLTSAIVALWPLAAGARPASAADLTPDQVRAEFLRQGYRADAPTTWWTNQVTTFTVVDPAEQASPSARIVMVLVYPDAATAQAERSRAQGREAADLLGRFTGDRGPHLVPGYGMSTWRQNVALVQSTRRELEERFAAELDLENMVLISTGAAVAATPAPAIYAVDFEFLAVLDGGVVNL
jgi:hypothetical protein